MKRRLPMLCAALVTSCGAPCVTTIAPATCTPLYAPTFDNVYAMTLHPTCAQNGASCHSSEGAMGGLVYEDPDTAYALLLGTAGGTRFVVAGDASCSVLTERLESTDPSFEMPPGSPLSLPERCAIEQWIQNGAAR